jgi:flagellum-specific ATP synthase
MTVVSTGRTRVDEALEAARPQRLGRLVELKGLHLLARGVDAAVGGLVEVTGDAGAVPAEVVASTPQGVVCLPLGNPRSTPAIPSATGPLPCRSAGRSGAECSAGLTGRRRLARTCPGAGERRRGAERSRGPQVGLGIRALGALAPVVAASG